MKLVDNMFDPQQGRKYRLFYVALFTGFIASVIGCFFPNSAGVIIALLSFIGGLYAIYCTGNTAESWVTKKPDSKIGD